MNFHQLVTNAVALGSPRGVAEEAMDNLLERRVAALGVSGGMLSGKDSLAPRLMDDLGYPDAVRVGFSDGIRKEAAVAMAVLTGMACSRAERTDALVDALGLVPAHAAELVDLHGDSLADPDHSFRAADRTAVNRRIEQGLGGPWRTVADPLYWARTTTLRVIDRLAAGDSVYLTGGRLVPDIIVPRSVGVPYLRLDVTRETQLARMFERDGISADVSVLDHSTETGLDDFDDFDARIRNDGTIDEARSAAIAALVQSDRALSA